MSTLIRKMAFTTCFSLLFTTPVGAQPAGHLELLRPESGSFEVPLYKSGIIDLPQAASRISVGNPGIADILILRSQQLYVLGKALGTTNVVLWDKKDRIFASFDVEVTHDLDTLKLKLHQLFPGEEIQVHSAQERIILSGQASSLVRMNAAEELAYSFLPECIAPDSNVVLRDATQPTPVIISQGGGPRQSTGNQECKEGKVVNLMQVGGAHQVMLEIKVAEVARTVLKRLDANFNILSLADPWTLGAVNGGATFPNEVFDVLDPAGSVVQREVPILRGLPIGPVIDRFEPTTPSIQDTGAFFSYLGDDHYYQAVIEASRQKGLAKILAEPTLTTQTGQEAKFLSGGEFPIPVPQGGITGGVTIEFKEFGVGVKFLPTVLDSGRINLKLNVAVSELSSDNNVVLGITNSASTFFIPSLTKRSASSTVELANGQTIGIAGLISDNVREVVDKLPGLGDIPILGSLFRSQEFLSGQTELVMFVTPHLAKPIARNQVRLPTDSFVPPSDLDFYLMGRMEGSLDSKQEDATYASPEANRYGHDL